MSDHQLTCPTCINEARDALAVARAYLGGDA